MKPFNAILRRCRLDRITGRLGRAGDQRLWILLAGTTATLSLAAALKGPCLAHAWDGFQFERLCYNDIQPLYYGRGFSRDRIPYVQESLEYPVLTGVLMLAAALLSSSVTEFVVWNGFFLSLFALGTTWLLFALADDKRRVSYWAAGGPLLLYAFHNWDLLAVFFGVLGIFLFQRGRVFGAGLSCALGASAKLFPLFFLPVFAVSILARERRLGSDAWRLGFGALSGLVGANGPFILTSPTQWWATYAFHLRRAPNFETTWYVISHYGERWNQAWMTELIAEHPLAIGATTVLMAVMVLVCAQVWRGRLGTIEACLMVLLGFMLLNKVFSVQYSLWILPFFVLLRLRGAQFIAFAGSDLAVYLSVFTLFLHFRDGRFDEFFDLLALAVVARASVQVWIFLSALRPGRTGPAARPAISTATQETHGN